MTRDQLEIEKMAAEIRKLQAEVENIQAQASDSKKHWLGKPSSWVPILAGIAAIASAFTQMQLRSLDDSKQALALEKQTLQFERNKDKLDRELQESKRELAEALAAKQSAEIERQSLQLEADALSVQVNDKQHALADLTSKLKEHEVGLRSLTTEVQSLPIAAKEVESLLSSNARLVEAVEDASKESVPPLSSLRQYHSLVNQRDMDGAYLLFSQRRQKKFSRKAYGEIFANTKSIEVLSQDVVQSDSTTAYINIVTRVTSVNQKSEEWNGTVMMKLEGQSWKIDEYALKRR